MAMVEEAPLVDTGAGLEPRRPGWFVLNAREARWLDGHFGAYTRFGVDERRLRARDFVHGPPWTEHVFVGADDGLCAIMATGRRRPGDVVYPASELALKHAAGVEVETREAKEAYWDIRPDEPVGYRDGWL
jgi:hypothetical protein